MEQIRKAGEHGLNMGDIAYILVYRGVVDYVKVTAPVDEFDRKLTIK